MIVIDPIAISDTTFVSSTVPETDYPAYNPATNYTTNARVIYAHVVYQSVAGGIHPITDPAFWAMVGPTNQWAMFDDKNSTVTSQAESIEVVLAPHAIAQGLFIGGVSAATVQVQVILGGVVLYNQTLQMIRNTMGSSYYNWVFGRIERSTAEVVLDLPPVYDGQVKVTISNPGNTAKVAIIKLGPTRDSGFTQYGIGRDIQDYSTEIFDVDGDSITTLRGYSKGMTLDVKVDNSDFDSLVDWLESSRQKSLVWVGVQEYKQTLVFGKYASFKTVIDDINYSRCSLTIKGKI
jgi:hypothetical protein